MLPPFISLLGNLASGSLADSYGRRPIMLLGAVMQTLMFALFACSFSPWVDYVAFIGAGLGGALYRAPSLAMVADLVDEQDRRGVFALFATTNNIGSVIGPALVPFSFSTIGNLCYLQLLVSCLFIRLAFSFSLKKANLFIHIHLARMSLKKLRSSI